MEHNYRWEAEKSDGSIMNVGGDLTDCIRFSMIPKTGCSLPQHDLVGISLKRRFTRTFKHSVLSANLQATIVHCVVAKGFRLYVDDSTGRALVAPEDYDLYL